MIRSLIVFLVCLSFAGAIALADEPYRPVPMIKAIDPDTVKGGGRVDGNRHASGQIPSCGTLHDSG